MNTNDTILSLMLCTYQCFAPGAGRWAYSGLWTENCFQQEGVDKQNGSESWEIDFGQILHPRSFDILWWFWQFAIAVWWRFRLQERENVKFPWVSLLPSPQVWNIRTQIFYRCWPFVICSVLRALLSVKKVQHCMLFILKYFF